MASRRMIKKLASHRRRRGWRGVRRLHAVYARGAVMRRRDGRNGHRGRRLWRGRAAGRLRFRRSVRIRQWTSCRCVHGGKGKLFHAPGHVVENFRGLELLLCDVLNEFHHGQRNFTKLLEVDTGRNIVERTCVRITVCLQRQQLLIQQVEAKTHFVMLHSRCLLVLGFA